MSTRDQSSESITHMRQKWIYRTHASIHMFAGVIPGRDYRYLLLHLLIHKSIQLLRFMEDTYVAKAIKVDRMSLLPF